MDCVQVRLPGIARTIFAGGIALLTLVGCSSNTPIYGPVARAGVAIDFPIPAGAVVHDQTYGPPPLPDGSKDRRERDDVTWGSDDAAGKLFAYYKDNLAIGDWIEQSAKPDARGGGTIVFNRKSNPNFGGEILLSDGRIHVIMGDGCPCGVPT